MGKNTEAKSSVNIKAESFTEAVDLIKNYAIFTLDLEGHITSWNKGAATLTGWKIDEVLGKCFDFLYPARDVKRQKPQNDLQRAAVDGSYEDEGWLIKQDRKLFLADINISQIHDEKSGKHIGYVKVFKDVTERRKSEADQIDANALLRKEIIKRKNIEKALKESNAELEAFASAASHDLQEPLRMVISYLQLIDRRYRQKFDKDGKEFLEFAVDGAMRMRTLISDLVEYARIDSLAKPFRRVDMNKLLLGVLNNLSLSLSEADVKVTYDDLPEVWGDEVQLTQVFQNLIANAIKFRDKKPAKVHVSVEKKENEYIFKIEDNGIGMHKKNFNKVFLIFKQVGNRQDRQGSGVGLAMVKKIVNRHYGRIWVESIEGEGSKFYFTIPISIKYKGDQA